VPVAVKPRCSVVVLEFPLEHETLKISAIKASQGPLKERLTRNEFDRLLAATASAEQMRPSPFLQPTVARRNSSLFWLLIGPWVAAFPANSGWELISGAEKCGRLVLFMRLPMYLLAILALLFSATLAVARAAPNMDPVPIERAAVARGAGGEAAAQILAAFLAKDAVALERMGLAQRFDKLTVSAHYSSGLLDCPANPKRCEAIRLTLYGWQGYRPILLSLVRFSSEDLAPEDRAQAMRLERRSTAGITGVIERLVYSNGRFTPEVWLLVRPDESMAKEQLPADSEMGAPERKRLQRQLLAQEGFVLADSSVNSDTSGPAMPEATRWFHLLGSLTPQNVTTIGPSTVWLLSSMLGIDPSHDIPA